MSRAVLNVLGKAFKLIHRGGYVTVVEPIHRASLASCGTNVRISPGCSIAYENTYVGDSVFIGPGARFMSSRANIIIGNHVMFGPDVTIVTGDHRTDIPGRPMDSVREDEKLPENDQDVVIEDDVWVGNRAMILKGVTIGYGSIVAAGALVTKDVAPYSVVGGIPARLIRYRFDQDVLEELKRSKRYQYISSD